ncbi:MAG: hypothetical protein B7Y02_02885, partial [Rhodobacterales bacterium 17-64-5]
MLEGPALQGAGLCAEDGQIADPTRGRPMTTPQTGILSIIAACAIWGFAPLYYHHLTEVPAVEMMAHRTLWTAICFGLVVTFAGRWGQVRGLVGGPDRWRILAAALLIGFNWFLFIWAVVAGKAVEASLGYYIYPL